MESLGIPKEVLGAGGKQSRRFIVMEESEVEEKNVRK